MPGVLKQIDWYIDETMYLWMYYLSIYSCLGEEGCCLWGHTELDTTEVT